MLTLDFKPSFKVINQISQIERFSGFWEHVSESINDLEEKIKREIEKGSESALLIDTSSPGKINLEANNRAALLSLITAHYFENDRNVFSFELVLKLQKLLSSENLKNLDDYDKENFRSTPLLFATEEKEPVFQTTPSFLISGKLRDLIDWTNRELETENLHPLIIVPVFYLLFLQIHPFSSGNERLVVVLSWRLLFGHGYSFVASSHFASQILKRKRNYYQSLRQAEKSVNTNWTTLNVWLEFFLDNLIESIDELQKSIKQSHLHARLTAVQKQIIQTVKTTGAATREQISKETGINISTVKYNLCVLSRRGQLRKNGGGRTTSYSLL